MIPAAPLRGLNTGIPGSYSTAPTGGRADSAERNASAAAAKVLDGIFKR